jgi:hypothetical protein
VITENVLTGEKRHTNRHVTYVALDERPSDGSEHRSRDSRREAALRPCRQTAGKP